MPDMELENSSMVTYGVNASHVCREALKVARVIQTVHRASLVRILPELVEPLYHNAVSYYHCIHY